METKLIKALLECNYGITGRLASRYAKILVRRAVIFFLDDIDGPMVDEDLYTEKGKYVNLDFSEKEQEKIFRNEIENMS